MRVLVTGGAGYIGSITTLGLLEQGHEAIVFDNFVNSKPAVLDRIAALAGRKPALVRGDVANRALVERVLHDERVEAVIHFAALKAVGESVAQPLAYYRNNVGGTVALLEAMQAVGVRHIVSSSSATVYGEHGTMPLAEDAPTSAANPYGQSKLMIEQIITDLVRAEPAWTASLLRYFNPVGAHESGTLGEDPQGIPNNLMPYIAQVAVGRREHLNVYGDNWPTPDGTGVRDYVHVVDLAEGHLAALAHGAARPGLHVFNLGTGRGHSVLEVLAAFGRACGHALPHRIAPRRAGDVAANWADVDRAAQVLGWRATRSLDQMCQDAWRWQRQNPDGYPD